MPKVRNTLSSIIFQKFIDPPWPSFIRPSPDELFTSWLLRLSRNHLVRYYTFCSSYFNGAEFWNRDLDKFLPGSIRDIIINKSVLKADDINTMMLSSFNPNIFTNEIGNRNFWFTPFSVYNYKYAAKHRTTLSVCCSCLKNDGEHPYLRKHWRLSIYTICKDCNVGLIDSCPSCGMQINHLISEKGRKSQTPIFPITYCWKCLFDLKTFTAQNQKEEFTDMQGYFSQTFSSGYDIAHSLQYSHLYFSVLKKILSLLNKPNNESLKKLQELVCDETSLEFIQPSNGRNNPFELMDIVKRRNLLYTAYWLLADWPYRFRDLTGRAGVRSKVLNNDFSDIPHWFNIEVSNNRLVHSEWRKHYSEYSYSSFAELAQWRVSKIKRNRNPNKKRGVE